MKPKINEPMYISPRTYRDYDLYRWECGRAIGWNQAMDFIFGEREGEKKNESKKDRTRDTCTGIYTGAK